MVHWWVLVHSNRKIIRSEILWLKKKQKWQKYKTLFWKRKNKKAEYSFKKKRKLKIRKKTHQKYKAKKENRKVKKKLTWVNLFFDPSFVMH